MGEIFLLDLPMEEPASPTGREAAPSTGTPNRETAADRADSDVTSAPDAPRGPIASAWADARADSAARKQRGGNRRWAARWMREQPTSVADLVDYYLNQREERPDGRPGWGIRSAIPALDAAHACVYVIYGLTWGLACTLALYALAWMQQRPGRSALFLIGAWTVTNNISAWFAGPQ